MERLRDFKDLLGDGDARTHCVAIERRSGESQTADLRLRFDDRVWLRGPDGEALLASLRTRAEVRTAEARRSDVFVGLDAGTLESLEADLVTGEEGTNEPGSDLFRGERWDVSLVGPNANKALHLGHLRNVALGQALACSLEAAGADVRRRSLVADIGRRMCEAMAGYMESRRGETPESTGVGGDQFVELCSRDFRRGPGATQVEPSAGPNAQEDGSHRDTAVNLMDGWLAGAGPERDLAARMRRWVLAGHERTLARLGVVIDHYDFESEEIPRARELIERGLRLGLFEREAAGGVVYRSGRPEFATMVLLNESGAPTECARVLAVCHRMIEELDGETAFVEVLGDEWRPAQTVVADLLVRLLLDTDEKSYDWVYYGLVTAEGRKIGSSLGEPVWIDDFLDSVAAGPAVRALERIGEGRVPRADLVDILVRTPFLCAPMAQPLSFVAERTTVAESGPAWVIAEAWSRAVAVDPPARPAEVARAGVLQAWRFPTMLSCAIERRDPSVLANYLVHLSEAFLSAPEPGPAARPALERVLRALGFAIGSGAPDAAGSVSRSPAQRLVVGV